MRAALLYTEDEIVKGFGLSVDQFRKHKLPPAGSYTPPRAKPVPLYAKSDVDRLGRTLNA